MLLDNESISLEIIIHPTITRLCSIINKFAYGLILIEPWNS